MDFSLAFLSICLFDSRQRISKEAAPLPGRKVLHVSLVKPGMCRLVQTAHPFCLRLRSSESCQKVIWFNGFHDTMVFPKGQCCHCLICTTIHPITRGVRRIKKRMRLMASCDSPELCWVGGTAFFVSPVEGSITLAIWVGAGVEGARGFMVGVADGGGRERGMAVAVGWGGLVSVGVGVG